ncbi:hypothetical protein CWE02_10835 [Brucella pituitosa]|nr:hypothetical protein CWE02_10835 [Brucella pituitosa]
MCLPFSNLEQLKKGTADQCSVILKQACKSSDIIIRQIISMINSKLDSLRTEFCADGQNSRTAGMMEGNQNVLINSRMRTLLIVMSGP